MTVDSNYRNQVTLQNWIDAEKLHIDRVDSKSQRDLAIIEASIQWYEDLLTRDKSYEV